MNKAKREETIATTVEHVTPEMATEWLAMNTDNRPVKQQVVDRYVRIIKAGLWSLNGESIKFGPGGRLLDGQHRLWAVVEAGMPITTLVMRNVPEEAFSTIDTGVKRTVGDTLFLHGEKNSNNLGAALGAAWKLDNLSSAELVRWGGTTPSTAELEIYLQDNPGIRDSLDKVASGLSHVMSASMAAALHYAFGRRDKALADRFFEELASGAGLEATSPVFLLRERLTKAKAKKERLSQAETIEYCTKAWNALRTNKPVQKLQRTSRRRRASTASPRRVSKPRESFPKIM